MEENLIKFNENITKITKDILKYEDKKGNYMVLPINYLFCECQYLELTKKELEEAKFQKIVEKNKEYKAKTTTRIISKFEKTRNNKDKATLIDEEVEVYQVWVVRNGMKIANSFDNKEEALKTTKMINDKYFDILNS